MQPHLGAQGVQAVDQLLFVRPNELVVQLRADQRRGRVAHADQLGARVQLGLGKPQSHFEDEIEQPADKIRVVVKVEHQRVDAPQVGRFRTGAFDPAFDQLVAAHLFFQQTHAAHAIQHPALGTRVRNLQPIQDALVIQAAH